MNADAHRYMGLRRSGIVCVYLCLGVVSLHFLTGCADRTRRANVELRKQIQSLEEQIAALQRRHEADAASIRTLEQQRGTVSTLPQDRLDQLFTAHGIELDPLTSANETGLSVYVVPTDQEGQDLKAAGSFVVEGYDTQEDGKLLARCEYTVDQARQAWRGRFLSYDYVLECPWQTSPAGKTVRIRVTFKDLLTQREFSAEKVVERQVGKQGS